MQFFFRYLVSSPIHTYTHTHTIRLFDFYVRLALHFQVSCERKKCAQLNHSACAFDLIWYTQSTRHVAHFFLSHRLMMTTQIFGESQLRFACVYTRAPYAHSQQPVHLCLASSENYFGYFPFMQLSDGESVP